MLIDEAAAVLVAKCLEAATVKIDYTLIDSFSFARAVYTREVFGPFGNKRRYGLANMMDAARYGYHLPTAGYLGISEAADKFRQFGIRIATPRIAIDLFGARAANAGCVGRVNQQVAQWAGANKAFTSGTKAPVVQRITAESYAWSLKDREVMAAIAKWSRCMTSSGHPYPSPTVAGDDLDVGAPRASSAEKRTAIADVVCKRRTGLAATWEHRETIEQLARVRENRQKLQSVAASADRQLSLARAVLRSAGLDTARLEAVAA